MILGGLLTEGCFAQMCTLAHARSHLAKNTCYLIRKPYTQVYLVLELCQGPRPDGEMYRESVLTCTPLDLCLAFTLLVTGDYPSEASLEGRSLGAGETAHTEGVLIGHLSVTPAHSALLVGSSASVD